MKRWLALALLCSCAHSPWTASNGSYVPASQRYSLVLPEGWMCDPSGDALLATRDGPVLQRILANRTEFGKPLGESKKSPRKDMLPEEAAELMRDELTTGGGVTGVSVLENSPATFAGRQGFHLVLRFRTPDGLTMKAVVFGAIGDDALYELAYVAPERHYFDLDLPTFGKVRDSFHILRAIAR